MGTLGISSVLAPIPGTQLVDGDLYLFLGRDRRKCKAICYDSTGVLLVAKRMERGRLMRLEDLEEKEITSDELDWLLRGSVIRRAKFGVLPVDNRVALPKISEAEGCMRGAIVEIHENGPVLERDYVR